MQSFRQYLLESRTGFLYHYSVDAITTDMFRDGYFKLTSLYDDAEWDRSMSYKYFLSCSRIPRGGYNWNMDNKFPHTIFQLDANHLSHKYKIIPVNASHSDNGAVTYLSKRHEDENEDRILSNDKQIPFKGNVIAIHQYCPLERKYKQDLINKVIPYCKQGNIALYLYSDVSALGNLNIRKAVKVV